MLQLDGLYVVTGCLRVAGAEHRVQQTGADGSFAGKRTVSSEGQKGRNFAITTMKRLKKLSLLRTPLGYIVTPEMLPQVRRLIDKAVQEAIRFNRESANGCRMWNFMVWEPLVGNRLAAVEGWIAAHSDDAAVKKALQELEQNSSPLRSAL